MINIGYPATVMDAKERCIAVAGAVQSVVLLS